MNYTLNLASSECSVVANNLFYTNWFQQLLCRFIHGLLWNWS